MTMAIRGVVWIGVCLLLCGRSDVSATAAVDRLPGVLCGAVDGRLPATVQVDEPIVPHVQMMLQRSAHFRRQCRELAAHPHVYVRLQLAPVGELTSQFCAKSFIQRTAAGPLIAVVRIGRETHWSEWIPHELEHVLEAAGGMRIRDYARGHDTWESADDTYETTRAINAGRTVRVQMRHKPVAATD